MIRLALFIGTALGLVALWTATNSSASTAGARRAAGQNSVPTARPLDANHVVGNQACVKCHTGEMNVWRRTPHAQTFHELHRKPEAKSIAAKLGIRSIKHEGRCNACHFTPQFQPGTPNHAGTSASHQVDVIAGVSCESCHGEAKGWIDVHHDYGGENVTAAMETPRHRAMRLTTSIEAGMRNPKNVYAVAQSCLRCHTTADEELVNVGGHSPGSSDFEFVSWSQGSVRHNFVRSNGKRNDVSSPERLRVMFVAGILAELEAGLRATAVASEKATYGVTVAKRTSIAGKKLASVSQKIRTPEVDRAVEIFRGVQLKLNHADPLRRAADEIAKLGYQFADQHDGSQFAALDRFIPDSSRWK